MKNKIFKILLEEENYISGEEISDLLGISRSGVWKHINSLKEDGYDIEGIPRKGYMLKNRVDKLLLTEIITELNLKHWKKENIYTYDTVDSTNIIAKKNAGEGKEEGSFFIAEEQTKGKGRMGRDWSSLRGKGIWFSFILRPEIMPTKASEITFVIAVGIMEGIKKQINKDIKIKWPNDILLDGKKIVGILTEISAEMERINYIIAGVGINVNQNIEDFPEDIRNKATSLKINTGESVNRNELLRNIIEEMERVYFFYKKEGFGVIIDIWKNNNITLGRRVKAITFDSEIIGFAERIDDEGYLIIKDDAGKENKILAGDVSLRNEDGSYF